MKQRPERLTYVLRFIGALVAAVAIHVPFALMKGNPPPVKHELDFGETTQAVSLPPPDDNLPDSIKSIYNWTKINDPTLLILPNYQLGFGHFIPPTPPIEPQPVPPIKEERNMIEQPILLSVKMDIHADSLAQLIAATWNNKTDVMLPIAQPIIPVHGVFWRAENGRLLLNPPENDIARQTLAISHGLPTTMTQIEIEPNPLLPLPRVIVRKSCGNAELDMVAIDAVRKVLAKSGPLPLTPGAAPDKSLVLIIDWLL